jgi:uncharacterized protein YwgA
MFSKTTNSLMQLFTVAKKIEGKIKLQKIVYILQEKSLVDFELGYKYALYGPYSEDLQIEVEYLASIGFLKEEANVGTYELNESFPLKIEVNDGVKMSEDLISQLLSKESQLLEVTSTIYYLRSHQYKEESLMKKKIQLLKPNLQDRIESAFEFYSSLEETIA